MFKNLYSSHACYPNTTCVQSDVVFRLIRGHQSMGDILVNKQCAKTGVSVSSTYVKVKVGWTQQMIDNSTTQKAGQRIPQAS